MLTVWGRATSSNVQAVMWCIGELNLEYERHDVGHRHGGTDTPEFVAMNPNRTVPVLRDGDGPALWESAAILRYLAMRYGEGPFWPADPAERAHVDRWAEWSKLNVAMAFTVPIFWGLVRTASEKRDAAVIARGLDALESKLAIAEMQFAQHPWLAGDDFTLADIQIGHILYRYFDAPLDEVGLTRRDLPALRAYYERLTERRAYAEHVMVSYDELRVAGATA